MNYRITNREYPDHSLIWIYPACQGLFNPGGGGTLIFSSYVGSGPASSIHPQKYQEFQAPQKKYLKF